MGTSLHGTRPTKSSERGVQGLGEVVGSRGNPNKIERHPRAEKLFTTWRLPGHEMACGLAAGHLPPVPWMPGKMPESQVQKGRCAVHTADKLCGVSPFRALTVLGVGHSGFGQFMSIRETLEYLSRLHLTTKSF